MKIYKLFSEHEIIVKMYFFYNFLLKQQLEKTKNSKDFSFEKEIAFENKLRDKCLDTSLKNI